MAEWQPIETAPKDGTSILICGGTYMYDGGMYDDWFPSECCQIAWWFTRHEGGWCSGNAEGHDNFIWHKPTHWMPLPEPLHPDTESA